MVKCNTLALTCQGGVGFASLITPAGQGVFGLTKEEVTMRATVAWRIAAVGFLINVLVVATSSAETNQGSTGKPSQEGSRASDTTPGKETKNEDQQNMDRDHTQGKPGPQGHSGTGHMREDQMLGEKGKGNPRPNR
jgi:hypothetical protein